MKVEAVILAAGRSERAGTNKLLLELGGKKVIERSISPFISYCSRILVVTGHEGDRLAPVLRDLGPVVAIAVNPDYVAGGMLSSVKTGVRLLSCDRFFVGLADHPFVPPAVIELLLASPEEIAVPLYRGEPGHPVLFDSKLIPELLAFDERSSLSDFIGRKGYAGIETGERGILSDIDTREDYEKAVRERAWT